MKSKKGAFVNSSSGYGKSKNSYRNNAGKQEEADAKQEEKLKADRAKELHSEKDLNSGFGDYLRSPEAVEIMKLFVFANTIMLIVTMAWPHFKEHYYMLREWLESLQLISLNMVGPFMQGVLLMGIIYWYSKGMLSLINDYYRSEIQRKISVDGPVNESSEFINVDQIVEYHLDKIKNESERQQTIKIEPTTDNVEINDPGGAELLGERNSKVVDLKFLEQKDVCRRETRLEEFYKLVERKIHSYICL